MKTKVKKNWKKWLAAWGLWTCLGVYFASELSISANYRGGIDISFWEALFVSVIKVHIWFFLSLFIVKLSGYYLPTRKTFLVNLLKHLPWGILFSLVHLILYYTFAFLLGRILQLGFVREYSIRLMVNDFFNGFLLYWLIVGFISMLQYRQLYQERKQQTSRLENQLTSTQLQSLKMQLRPHFLFNTLNSISTLIDDDPKSAQKMLSKLSTLLRLTLESRDTEMVDLPGELVFIQNYLAIQKYRYGDRLQVSIDIDRDSRNARVPYMILQPLVENAVKYAVAPFKKGGEIRIGSHRENKKLHLRVMDNGPGLKEDIRSVIKQGTGLKNVKERLQYIYGKKGFEFKLKNGPESGLTVEITIPFVKSKGKQKETVVYQV